MKLDTVQYNPVKLGKNPVKPYQTESNPVKSNKTR